MRDPELLEFHCFAKVTSAYASLQSVALTPFATRDQFLRSKPVSASTFTYTVSRCVLVVF